MKLSEIERAAANGQECPKLILTEEKLFFEAASLLYRAWKSGAIQKDDASTIKKHLVLLAGDLINQREMNWAEKKRWDACELLLTEARKNGCDICKKIESTFYDTQMARRGGD